VTRRIEVRTSHGDVAELVDELAGAVDESNLVLTVGEEVSEGEWVTFVLHLADGTPVFEGVGRCAGAARSDDGSDRWDVLLGSLSFDERNEIMYERVLLAHESLETGAPTTGFVDIGKIAETERAADTSPPPPPPPVAKDHVEKDERGLGRLAPRRSGSAARPEPPARPAPTAAAAPPARPEPPAPPRRPPSERPADPDTAVSRLPESVEAEHSDFGTADTVLAGKPQEATTREVPLDSTTLEVTADHAVRAAALVPKLEGPHGRNLTTARVLLAALRIGLATLETQTDPDTWTPPDDL